MWYLSPSSKTHTYSVFTYEHGTIWPDEQSVNFCDIHRPLCKNPQLFLEEFFNTQRDKFRWVFIADLQPVDFENFFLFNDGTFNGLQAYKNSKAANIMFVSELAKRLGDSGVKVNAVCPGKKNSLQFVMYE